MDGIVVHRDQPGGGSISLAEIARHLAPDSPTLGERDPGLAAEGWFRTEHMTYPYGVQIGVVRVDSDTGEATVERFLLAYDIGRSINPMLVEGQLAGGFAQGLGGALCEEFRFDERGQPLKRDTGRLCAADRAGSSRRRNLGDRGRAEPAQPRSACRRGRHQRGRRGHCRGNRRGDWFTRRRDAAPGNAAAAQNAGKRGGAAQAP